MTREECARVVAWLQSLPLDSIVAWTSDHYDIESPYCGTWVDVIFPDMPNPGMNWMLTIHNDTEPEDEEVLPDWDFNYPTDKVAHGVFNPNSPDYWYIEEVVLNPDQEPSPDLAAHLDSVVAAKPGAYRSQRGVWSAAQVSEACGWWARKFASRPDLLFVWDANAEKSDFHKRLVEKIERMDAGEEPMYEIGTTKGGKKIFVTDEVMDFLLNEMTEDDE